MTKKTTKTKPSTSLAGKVVKLLHSLLDDDGQPHPYAGQEVTIVGRIKRAGAESYVATTADQTEIDVKHDDWGPTDAEMQKVISGESGTTPPDLVEALAAPVLAEQLATIALYTDPTLNVVQNIDLDLIDDSPFQSRTVYPEDYIQGLAESMKVAGMLSAMLLRPKADGRFENVFGHCRKRGARLAGVTHGPAIVRELTDAESAQLQAIENLQRKDLDPIDEARSFADYITAHKCTKDEFCRRTGLSRTLVYNRLKLATLGKEGRDAMRAGKIKAEVATLIARVPNEKHQAQAVKMILDKTWNVEAPDEVMTTRKARDMLREKFTLTLKGVLWAQDDATLVPSAGACTVCPKRSGVDPVLYQDLLGDTRSYYSHPKGENVCTDPACFDSKKTAQLKANQTVLESKGKTVIAGNKARQAIGADGQVKNGYIPLSEVRDAIKKATVKGKPAPEVVISVIQNPRDGKTVEVVKIDEVKAAGVKVAARPKSNHTHYGSPEWKEQEKQREAAREKLRQEQELQTRFNMHVLDKVREAAALVTRNVFDLQLVARVALDGVAHHDTGALEKLYKVGSIATLHKMVGSMDATALGQLTLDCALVFHVNAAQYGAKPPGPLLQAAKHYGVNVEELKRIAKSAGAEVSTGKAAKGAKGKAKAAAPAEADEEQEEGAEVEA